MFSFNDWRSRVNVLTVLCAGLALIGEPVAGSTGVVDENGFCVCPKGSAAQWRGPLCVCLDPQAAESHPPRAGASVGTASVSSSFPEPAASNKEENEWQEPRSKDKTDKWAVFAKWKATYGGVHDLNDPSPNGFVERPEKTTMDSRRRTWAAKFNTVAEHNDRFDKGEINYSLGLNSMSDLAEEERSFYMGARPEPEAGKTHASYHRTGENLLPMKWDFPERGDLLPSVAAQAKDWSQYDTSVKQQGQCGSCWAHAAIAAAENALNKAGWGKLNLSEQELVDCGSDNDSCATGWFEYQAMEYLNVFGVSTEGSYKYAGSDPETSKLGCRRDQATRAIPKGILEHVQMPTGQDNLARTLTLGPAAFRMWIPNDFFDYRSGVFDKPNCNQQSTGGAHAMSVVGFTDEYFIIKNSWGKEWGMNGYGWVRRTRGSDLGVCGIAEKITFPHNVQAPNPEDLPAPPQPGQETPSPIDNGMPTPPPTSRKPWNYGDDSPFGNTESSEEYYYYEYNHNNNNPSPVASPTPFPVQQPSPTPPQDNQYYYYNPSPPSPPSPNNYDQSYNYGNHYNFGYNQPSPYYQYQQPNYYYQYQQPNNYGYTYDHYGYQTWLPNNGNGGNNGVQTPAAPTPWVAVASGLPAPPQYLVQTPPQRASAVMMPQRVSQPMRPVTMNAPIYGQQRLPARAGAVRRPPMASGPGRNNRAPQQQDGGSSPSPKRKGRVLADLACRSSSEADVVSWAESHERGWKELAYWDSEESSDKAGNEGKTWVSLMGKAAGLDTATATANSVLDVALIHAGKCPAGYVEACDWAAEETGAGTLSIKAPVVLCVLYGELPACGASYFLGPKGGRCPAGTVVTSEAECRAAQRVLGLTAKKAWSGADAQVIEGCSWLPSLRGGHDLLWNEIQFVSGSTSDVLTPLCSRHGVSDVRLRASDRGRPASTGEAEGHPQGYRGVGHWDVTNAGSWAAQGTTFGHGLMELYMAKKACVETAQAQT